MRTIIAAVIVAFVGAGMAWGEGIPARAEGVQFVVAVRDQKGAPSTTASKVWNLEIGEAFPWICFVAPSGDGGWSVSDDDQGYSLLKIDGAKVVVRTENIASVSAEDTPSAAMAYRRMVNRYREIVERAKLAAAEKAERVQVLHYGAVDPREESHIQRKSQAIERGASDSEIAAIDSTEYLRLMAEELQRIRAQQVIFSGRNVVQY